MNLIATALALPRAIVLPAKACATRAMVPTASPTAPLITALNETIETIRMTVVCRRVPSRHLSKGQARLHNSKLPKPALQGRQPPALESHKSQAYVS